MLNLTNSRVAEYRTAPTADVLENSYVLKRVDAGDGTSGVAKATGVAGEDLVGITHARPMAATVRPVVGEKQLVAADGTFTLDFAPVKDPSGVAAVPASLKIVDATGAAVDPANVTLTGRVVKITGATVGAAYFTSYQRSVTLAELAQEGLPLDFANNVNINGGAAEFATGNSTVEVDFFDITADFVVGAPLYANANGQLTTVPVAADSPVFGRVSIAPSADYPLLGVAFNLAF